MADTLSQPPRAPQHAFPRQRVGGKCRGKRSGYVRRAAGIKHLSIALNGNRGRRGRAVVVRASDGRPEDYWWLKESERPRPDEPAPSDRRAWSQDLVSGVTESLSSTRISIWDTKPFWCQPWSIIFTGAGTVGISWDLLHWPWLTATLAGAIVVWWGFFLFVQPRLFDQYLQEAQAEGRDWMYELDLKPDVREKLAARDAKERQ